MAARVETRPVGFVRVEKDRKSELLLEEQSWIFLFEWVLFLAAVVVVALVINAGDFDEPWAFGVAAAEVGWAVCQRGCDWERRESSEHW